MVTKVDRNEALAGFRSTLLLGASLTLLIVIAGVTITEAFWRHQCFQHARLELEKRNRCLIEASLDLLVTIAPDGKITDVNAATEAATGRPRNELIGTDFCDYFTDAAKARAGYQQVFREGCVQDYELELRSRDGHLFPVLYNASVYHDPAGKVIGVFAAARDITERKRLEEELRARQAYTRSLIEASLDPLVTIAADGKIADVNAATEAITGRSRDELLGTDFCSYFAQPERAREGYLTVFRDGTVRDYELELRCPDGKRIPVLYNASVYRNKDGDVMGVFAAARDISEHKRAEEARIQANQIRAHSLHLQNAREEERALMARHLHDEVGQALSAAKMDLAWLSGRLNNKEELQSRIRTALRVLNEAMQWVRQICTELRPQVLDDFGLAAAIEAQSKQFADRTGIRCETDLEDIDLTADQSIAAFRIFQEAINNVAEHAHATLVRVSLQRYDKGVRLLIQDNGTGISDDALVSSQSLGLIGMRERAQTCGGELQIIGHPGQGTAVKVSMPVQNQQGEVSDGNHACGRSPRCA